MDVPSKKSFKGSYLLLGSLIGLLLGLLLGFIAKQGNVAALIWLSSVLEPVGTLWMNALRMIVLPLIIAYVITAVASFSDLGATIWVGGGAVVAHLILLLLCLGLMLLIVPSVVSFFEVTPAIRASLTAPTPPASPDSSLSGLASTIAHILPSNIFDALVNDQILPVFLSALLFALALSRVEEKHRRPIVALFEAILATLHVLIRWLLYVMPIAVFALIFALSVTAGTDLIEALLFFVAAFCGLLVVLIAFLYVITPLLSQVSLVQFAKALIPAQMVAIGTRSSLLCLPALTEGARDTLRLPESVVGLVMPLSVSMFKINKAVSGPLKLFFLAHLYGIPLNALALAGFFMAYILLSFSSPGIPSGGFFVSLPLYVALGIPVEGVVLLKAVDAIPDIFKTLVNVTEDMGVAALVARFAPEHAEILEPTMNT